MLTLSPISGESSLDRSAIVLWILGLLVSLYTFSACYFAVFSSLRHLPGPFVARFSRIWEFYRAIRGDIHSQTIDLHQRHGPVIRLGPNKYDFNTAEAVKTIYSLTTVFPKSSYYDAFVDPKAEHNLFTTRDPHEHSRLRRTQASLYSMTTIKSYEPFIDAQTAVLDHQLTEFAKSRQTLSLPDLLQKYAFDVIGEITFGKSFNLMQNEVDDIGVIDLIHKSTLASSALGIVPEVWPPLVAFLKMLQLPSPRILFDVAIDFLKQHKESAEKDDTKTKSGARTFAAKIVDLEREGKVTAWDAESACVSNIIAGSDTTAISLNSALYHIYTIPDVLKRLREEIDGKVKDGTLSHPVTFEEAQKMPYLQAVISEALRIHPAVGVPLVRVVPAGGARIEGHFFPQGTVVGVNAWGLSYNKALYGPDANVFRPERWFESLIGTTTSSVSQFTFGGGSRTCIGKNISLLEMAKVLPQIVRKFDIVIDSTWKLSTHWFVNQYYTCTIERRSVQRSTHDDQDEASK